MSGLFIRGKWHTEFSLRSPRFRRELNPQELAILAIQYPITAILHAFQDLPEDVLVKVAGTQKGASYLFYRRGSIPLPEAAWVAAAEADPVTALRDAAEYIPHAARLAAARKEPQVALQLPGASRLFSDGELAELRARAEAYRLRN